MRTLITGFAGTIGGEFTRQLLAKGWQVTGVDSNEWAVAQFEDYPNLDKKLDDFKNVGGDYDLIIHCAAYKHVDLIESNQDSAYSNNVVKTANFYNNIQGKVLFISTDKAVEPASFYGETKKIGEELTAERGGVIARLGNVMSSNGSVIPKWEKCIEEGKPLPITDPNMTRYMIPVEKAVASILELLSHAQPGQVIIPEMGEPVRLKDLVYKVLIKHDFTQPHNYPTEIIGLRPGEKMHEKLKWDDEKVIYQNDLGMIVERKKWAKKKNQSTKK
jgi:FlaA1/EpsC-like NDP-sugar epimerase